MIIVEHRQLILCTKYYRLVYTCMVYAYLYGIRDFPRACAELVNDDHVKRKVFVYMRICSYICSKMGRRKAIPQREESPKCS